MRNLLFTIATPLFSLFILTLGNGLFTTLLSVRLHLEGADAWVIGLVSSAYYAGLAIGAFRIEPFINRVGHIRAFSAFASMLSVCFILQGLVNNIPLWIVLRLVGGFATAGLFVVIESWLLVVGSVKARGQVLAFYMIALYLAQSLSQFLLNLASPKELTLFAIAAMLSALSVIPLAMTRVGSPCLEEPSTLNFKKLFKVSASGVVGSFNSGLILGAVYGLMPLFIMTKTHATSDVGLFMAVIIFGGMALQYPIGRISDYIERRIVLIGVCFFITLFCLSAIFAFSWYYLAMVNLFLFGGFVFTLYPISTSYACDNLENKDMMAGTQGLLLAYSVGATLGPLLASLFVHFVGVDGLFIYILSISVLSIIFFTLRRMQKSDVSPQEEQFISVVQTTAAASELDPRSDISLN